ADRNRSHWSTSKTPSYTKSVSWQHHQYQARIYYAINDKYHIICGFPSTQVRFPAKPEPHFSA
ncbi:hypothetical protein, partial [Escherichia coli]